MGDCVPLIDLFPFEDVSAEVGEGGLGVAEKDIANGLEEGLGGVRVELEKCLGELVRGKQVHLFNQIQLVCFKTIDDVLVR